MSRFSLYPDAYGLSNSLTLKTHRLPVLLLLYSIGISSVLYNKFTLLNKVFNLLIPSIKNTDGRKFPLIKEVNANLIDKNDFYQITHTNKHTPISRFIYEHLRDYFIKNIENDKDFDDIFDIFEYLLSLNYLHIVGKTFNRISTPYGEYKWREEERDRSTIIANYSNDPLNSYTAFFKKAETEKEKWMPVKDGMFNGSYQAYIEVKNDVDSFLKDICLYY